MRILLIPVIVALSACASTPKSADIRMAKTNSLSARTLSPGECGLFVWTADIEKRFMLFSQSQENRGVWHSPDGETPIVITAKSGTPTDGQYPKQSFGDAGLTLALKGAEAITQGTRYKAGTLSQVSPEGWNKVTPVVSLSMCQTA